MIEKFFDKLLGKRLSKIVFENIGNFSLIKEDNMKTIKIIDLYILIANKEFDKLPEKIKYRNVIFILEKRDDFINYKPKEGDWLLNQFLWKLNDEAEILEDEKKLPEKLTIYNCADAYNRFDIIENRKAINKIIDYLETKGE